MGWTPSAANPRAVVAVVLGPCIIWDRPAGGLQGRREGQTKDFHMRSLTMH